MSKVFFSVAMSLDGFSVPDGMDVAHWDDPGYKNWQNRWLKLQKYNFRQKFFRENLKLGTGGETGPVNQYLKETFERTGANIMGKRMFEMGEQMWPEEAPFHTPVFVLTKEVRAPWERPGGTTFSFINDGIESALRLAREAAGGKDIRISGGPNVIQQYLNAGLVDEFTVALSPVFFGDGTRLFDHIDRSLSVEITKVLHDSATTHLRYTVSKQAVAPAE
jgi:dihydrofolate reductase